MSLRLYSYWRATAPYRVRIGLALKGLSYDYQPIHLAQGEQHADAYKQVNRQSLTPSLELGDGQVLTQSQAILEWLDETHPEPRLLPADAVGRARVRAMFEIVACDVHPLNNLRVLRALAALGADEAAQGQWIARWIDEGFGALEPMIAQDGAGFAYGDTPGLADCALIPQVYSAERFKVDLSPYPAIRAVAKQAAAHPAFQAAHPSAQPDAPPARP